MKSKRKILAVDDEPNNLKLLKNILSEDFQMLFALDGQKALDAAETHKPDLILLDVMMPGLSGYDVCTQLKENSETKDIPVIFVTAMGEIENEGKGFDLGAVDYITKPVTPSIVLRRVKTHMSLVRIEELEETRLEIVHRLGRAAEFKDNETGLHVIRMSHYSHQLALAAGCSEDYAKTILEAAPMHDIGKIGVSDSIILKPGPLTDEEFDAMKEHPAMGAEIIGEHDSPLLAMAREIALCHHEKWNGSGYPNQLAGEDIPLSARIIMIADVFDALTTKRPYKEAWPIDKALGVIKEDAGSHFDPKLAEIFLSIVDEILEVKKRWEEDDA